MKSAKLLDEIEQKLAEREVLKTAVSDLDKALTRLDKHFISINLFTEDDNAPLTECYNNLMLELNNIRILAN